MTREAVRLRLQDENPPTPPPAMQARAEAPQNEAAEVSPASRTLLIQAAALAHLRAPVAAAAFATEVAMQFGCSRVIVGFLRASVIEPYAVSQGGGDQLTGESFELPAAAMDEVVVQGCSVYLPASSEELSRVRTAHLRWQQRQGGTVLSVPLVHLGETVGALACEWTVVRPDMASLAQQIEDMAAFCGPILSLLHERDRPWPQRFRLGFARLWRRWRAVQDRRVHAAAIGLALALLALTALPVDYDVAGRARIEGEYQRVLVAPAEGFLKMVHVRPGDAVRTGQVLVEMAEQDLSLEQQRWASELAQQESAYAGAMARADRAQMVIAQAKAEQARSELTRTQARLQRATVVAPFDGVVIQGDLSQRLGAPLERGETLLVVAPQALYRVVVDIDERDIANVAPGQRGALSLASQPWQPLPLEVRRVTPVARAGDGRNVFEVEAALQAGAQPLRPGLEGVARVVVGREPLAWIWTHRLVDWVRVQAWNWWG
mgnify:FL=1